MNNPDWVYRMVIVIAAVLIAINLGMFMRRTVTTTEELEHRISTAEISTSELIRLMAERAALEKRGIPTTVCVQGTMNVMVVEKPPAEGLIGVIVFQWANKDLLVHTKGGWFVMPWQSYTWTPGRCQ